MECEECVTLKKSPVEISTVSVCVHVSVCVYVCVRVCVRACE